jgi:hypothetical protein
MNVCYFLLLRPCYHRGTTNHPSEEEDKGETVQTIRSKTNLIAYLGFEDGFAAFSRSAIAMSS